MKETMKAGQAMAVTLRKYFSITKYTPRWRNGENMIGKILQAVTTATYTPDAYSYPVSENLRAGYNVVLTYYKRVCGYRLPTRQIIELNQMKPYEVTDLLAQMVDDGVTNCGEAEEWFRGIALDESQERNAAR